MDSHYRLFQLCKVHYSRDNINTVVFAGRLPVSHKLQERFLFYQYSASCHSANESCAGRSTSTPCLQEKKLLLHHCTQNNFREKYWDGQDAKPLAMNNFE